MTELVFRAIRKITHADWLLRGRYFTILRFFLGPLNIPNNGMCLNITACFLQSCLLKNTINESRLGVNEKRHKKANRIK